MDIAGFGARLASIMKEKGLNQVQLADKMGVSQTTISRYISGEEFPRYRKLSKLVATLGVSITELTGDIVFTPGRQPTGISVTLEKLKALDTEQLIAELKRRGFPEKAIEFVRSLEGKDLEPWQVDAT